MTRGIGSKCLACVDKEKGKEASCKNRSIRDDRERRHSSARTPLVGNSNIHLGQIFVIEVWLCFSLHGLFLKDT